MPTLNPWVILGGVLLMIALCAGSALEGRSIGIDQQKVVDQNAIDEKNVQIDGMKSKAASDLAAANADRDNRKHDADVMTNNLEKEHAKNANLTEMHRTALDAIRLRFSADPARRGDSGQDPHASAGTSTSDSGSASCQLSEQADRSLKSLAYDADTLRDDYKLLYDWAHGVTCY